MSDDFFSTVPLRTSTTENVDHDDFAQAISLRFGSADLRTPRLHPADITHNTPRRPNPPPPPPDPHQPFSSIQPELIPAYLDDPNTLILDIRPHAAHAAARINNAISLSVPTTLLKRPLFSLSKLSLMLPSPSSRARFATWPSASRILVYDSDSVSSPDNSIIAGLLRKFRAEGFTGELAWIRGGFQAVWRQARDLATTDIPPPEEDDPDPISSSATLRTSHLPKAAFSLHSTTSVPPPRLGPAPLPNTPAPSASRAANPFFDTIRQNVELSHGITERIPLRIPRRVRRRIHDLPFPWLQHIASRSAVKPPSASRNPGLDGLESGSESSDDPHTSDPDENDPNVEEGTEALAMQFYRIELAEQRRLRSIMEHHTKESDLLALTSPAKSRRALERRGPVEPVRGGVSIRTGAKSVPGTPHLPPFPFSITAGVEKGTKNRYTHIWPFEHARVRLHDSRHQGSHPGKRDKSRPLERGRSTRERAAVQSKGREQALEQDKHRRSRSSPAFGKSEDQDVPGVVGTSKYSYTDPRLSITRTRVGVEAGLTHPTLNPGPSVPQVNILYDVVERDSRVSGPPTPATAFPLPSPPFYTPMEISPWPTPMRARSPQQIFPSGIGVSSGARLGGAQSALPLPSSPSLGPLSSFPLRLPNHQGGLSPNAGEQVWAPETLPSSTAPTGSFPSSVGTVEETTINAGTKRDLRRESSPVDDYVNASYVQPLGTRKRYIATQGPLPSTYVDFWTLVWEQNVHVIVMLTREVENAMVKCGSYWTNTEFGPLRLQLLSTSPPMSPSAHTSSMDVAQQGFFAIREPRGRIGSTTRNQPTLITREFALSHTSYPGVPPRRITHLQYLDWSDMNVPDDPRGVLDLVRSLEKAIADSTPGPSPSESPSPGSVSGSLSGGQSSDAGLDQMGHDTSLLSPTRAGYMPRGGRRRRGSEWRHPELDSKTGIASFALGKAAPVLLHCSAGVGRTGGFIAVDAVLDGIRREVRKNREERELKKASGVKVVERMGGKADTSDVETSGEFSLESTEAGVNSVESGGKESASDESERMNVDEPAASKTEKAQDSLHMINTVPIPVSAGERTKSRRRHYHGKDSSGMELPSSFEPLVVHVPFVEADGVRESVTSIDLGAPKVVGWQSSTREWAEQVSDQTHAHAGEADRPPPPSRERSPGGASNSSGRSALNSADDSVNGSVGATASGSASGSGSGNKVERKSGTGSASGSGTGSGSGSGTGSGSRSGRPPPSSSSKPGSGSISLSNSGSGTGTGSRLGSSLLRVRLRDSSLTSVSIGSTDSHSPRHEPKLSASLHRPSATHTSSSSDMEIDPPRPVSAPLQPTRLSTMVRQRAVHSRLMLGSSPVASFSSPVLPPGPVERGISFGDAGEGPVLLPNSDTGSDVLPSPPRESERAEGAKAGESEGSGQPLVDEPDEPSVPSRSRSKHTQLSSLRIPGTLHSSSSAKSPPPPSRESKGKERATIPLMPCVPDGSVAPRHFPLAPAPPSMFEHDQRNADHPVIDYKLPRELHSNLSPPLISSFAEPICTVIQDMREQRMSLCQSLRQYVFVHAAIIEGALRIVDEEHELWGSSGVSDDASSAEGESVAGIREGGQHPGYSKGTKAWFGGMDRTEVAVKTLEPDLGAIPYRIRPLHIPASSSSGATSPSKGKRGPSPTELLKEDKTGALSLNKRPSILRQTTHEGDQFVLESNRSSPATGEHGGGSREIMGATRSAPGQPVVPEKGGLTGSNRANFE